MLPARELKMMILHVIKNFPAIIALFLSPCGHWSWSLEERLSVPPLSGREKTVTDGFYRPPMHRRSHLLFNVQLVCI